MDLTTQETLQKVENFFKYLESYKMISFDTDLDPMSQSGLTPERNSLERRMSRFSNLIEEKGLRTAIVMLRNQTKEIDDVMGTANNYLQLVFPPRRYPELWV